MLRAITSPRNALAVFLVVIFTIYGAWPWFIDHYVEPDEYFALLASVTFASCAAVFVGAKLPIFDSRFSRTAARIAIKDNRFHILVWSAFVIFMIFTIMTAPSIPILSALSGASVQDLDMQRGEFLKLRTGAEAILVYLSTLFTSALLPCSLAQMYLTRHRLRHLSTLIFLVFAVMFLVKALFITVLAPILYVTTQGGRRGGSKAVVLSAIGLGILYLLTRLAVGVSEGEIVASNAPPAPFHSSAYVSSNPAQFIIWRAVAVPMFTAADTLRVFFEELHGDYLLGATSSLVAGLFGMSRVPLEQMVYAYQFGANDLANSNAVYITDAFANFGYTGVIMASLLVGQVLRWFRLSSQEAFRAQWLLFFYMLFTGGLFGVLLSNGYMLIMLMLLFVKLTAAERTTDDTSNFTENRRVA